MIVEINECSRKRFIEAVRVDIRSYECTADIVDFGVVEDDVFGDLSIDCKWTLLTIITPFGVKDVDILVSDDSSFEIICGGQSL